MALNITDLPNEILQQIVLCLPARSLSSFQRVCHRFNALVDPLIWRRLCRDTYRYWRPQHRIEHRFRAGIDETNWKALFRERQLVDRLVNTTLNSILGSQIGRIEKFQEIINHGYDAKDCLLQHCKVGEEAEDVLARRYHGEAVLGCIHRTMAVEEWAKVRNLDEVTLERAIGAFDSFVVQDRSGDFNETSGRLDEIAHSIRLKNPKLDDCTTREKAVILNKYLRAMRLVGVYDDRQNNHPRNHFLGVVLYSKEHSSLTLISAVIYCCVARRLGLDVSPGVFPFQVLAVVKPQPGLTLEDELTTSDSAGAMYMNPFAADEEIPVEDLIAQLVAIGAPRYSHESLLCASTTPELVLRAARNIFNSVFDTSGTGQLRHGLGSHRVVDSASAFPDLEASFYGALWALLLLGVPPDGDGPAIALRRRNYLPHIIEQFETNFPYDIRLVEQYILPLFQSTGEHIHLRESIRVMRSVDSMPKTVKRRRRSVAEQVKYTIGQVFVHKRYNYQAVITGWDVECRAHEHWIAQMRINELSRGRHQSFYHVLVEDKSVRYVAQENIEPILPAYPNLLMPLAGRHFKRWDKTARRFVSNIVDEYPDD